MHRKKQIKSIVDCHQWFLVHVMKYKQDQVQSLAKNLIIKMIESAFMKKN